MPLLLVVVGISRLPENRHMSRLVMARSGLLDLRLVGREREARRE